MLYCTGITVWRVRFPFRLTFSHNLASRNDAETLLVAITTSAGFTGYGQILPRSYLTGESLESAQTSVIENFWPALKRRPLPERPDVEAWREAVDSIYRDADAARANAAWAGLDVAGWDAWARSVGLDVPAGNDVPLVGVVPACGPRKAALLTRVLRLLGYRRFKVKVGRDAKADALRVAAVRRAVGARAWLAADANAAWDWDEAVVRMRELAGRGVAVVEEPLNATSATSADFRRLESETGVAAMADESLCTLADAAALLERGTPSWWNLRLAKNGGISGYRALAALAAKHSVRVYGGILVGEAGVLAAAAREAWRDGSCMAGEYGFSRVFIAGDPFRGSPAGYRGRLVCRASRGLGVTLRRDAMARLDARDVFSEEE